MTQTRSTVTRRRPASMFICIVFFALDLLLAFRIVLVSPNLPWDLFFVVQTALITTGLLCLLIYPRSQITYYITSAALLTLALKVLYCFVRDMHSVQQDAMFVRIALGIFGLAICLLLWRFTFARPSRLFYGFVMTDDTKVV